MQETPMLFPIAPGEFLKQIRTTIEEVVTEKLNHQTLSQTNSHHTMFRSCRETIHKENIRTSNTTQILEGSWYKKKSNGLIKVKV